jgi:hypothetical protein
LRIRSVVEPTRITEVNDRVRDFTSALRQAGAPDIAQRIEGYAAGFIDSTQVRRSVDAIKQQLQYYRACPHELPDLPIVQVAANRLEDVCKDALRAGVIEPARPSLRAASKRKLGLVTTTLSAAGVVLLMPLLVSMLGVDLSDLFARRTLGPLPLLQGDELSASVNVLVASQQPAATSGVEFYVAGRCARDLPGGASCRPVGPRAFGAETLPSYELLMDGQAYGVFVAFGRTRMLGAVGTGSVLVAASAETPEGQYAVPLQAAFVGYSPERCGWLARLRRQCEPAQRAAHARDEDLPVPTLLVEVKRGVPGQKTESERRRERAEAAERLRAEQRAAAIAGAVAEIKTVLDDTQGMLRHKRYDAARERLDKLTELFAPLDALAVTGSEAELPPPEVSVLRARFEAMRSELGVFGDRAFDVCYAALTRPRAAGQGDDAVLAATAQKLGISREFMEAIYAEHADQLEQRLARQEEAKRAAQRAAAEAVEKRCGALPTGAWREVQAYLAGLAQSAGVKTRLDECFTPRLVEARCWSVVCKFAEIVPDPERLTDKVTPHTWTFTLQKDRVVSHVERALE